MGGSPVLFNSIDFLLFFPLVTAAYFLLPHRVRWVWLLVSSYYFYMCWNPRYVVLIALSTVVTSAATADGTSSRRFHSAGA